jgi:hypothetical protein
MITKQRKVGGSMVFTVPKEFNNDSTQMYQVSKKEDGTIIYTPVTVKTGA